MPEDENRGYIVKVGDMAPVLTLDLINGNKVTPKDLKGKVVMLQFTASWCSVCRKEMPHIESDIWQKHKDNKDFVLIGIDKDEPLEKIKNMQEVTGVSYPLAFDPGAKHFLKFAHEKAGITRNVIIDKTGKIVFLTRLFDQAEFDAMKAKIEELLAGS